MFDEAEAYLRHRERIREREKREKLRKEGKLAEYLQEVQKAERKPVVVCEPTHVDLTLEKYSEIKKLEPKSELVNYSKLDCVVEKKKLVKKLVKKKVKKSKKPRVEDPEIVIEDAEEFKPPMAGSTGLPVFFFSNLVKQNCSAFKESETRNRMSYKAFPRKCWRRTVRSIFVVECRSDFEMQPVNVCAVVNSNT